MQVAAFLGVVCTVIMGISHRDGDMIMGLVNVILFQQLDGILQSWHEDIISEMLQNVSASLSKFDLDSQTTICAVCPACHCIYKPAFKTDSTV